MNRLILPISVWLLVMGVNVYFDFTLYSNRFWWAIVLDTIFGIFYAAFIIWLWWNDIKKAIGWERDVWK